MKVTIGFDRGTILVQVEDGAHLPVDVPGVRWDPRVGCLRAPAVYYEKIIERLGAQGCRVDDRALASLPPLAAARTPDLRPYQAAALDAWGLAGRRGIVSLPTGSGKTFVAASAIAALGRSTLCLVPTRILLEQWRRVLAKTLALDVGCYGDGVREASAVTVATYESAWRHMREFGNRFELLVVDEAHHFGRGVRDEALEMSTARFRLGLTATPHRDSVPTSLENLIGPLVFEVALGDLTGSFLADFDVVDLRLDLSTDERARYEAARRTFLVVFQHFQDLAPGASWTDFLRWAARTPQGRSAISGWHQARQVLALTQAKNDMLRALLRRHRSSRVLVFTPDKESAYRIAREHLVMPITADIGRREREEMLAAFLDREIGVLVSARVLNEGFDVPAADVGIVVGGALGEREHTQRVGRLLRPAEGKRAIIYELVTRDTIEVSQARRRKRGIQSNSARSL